MPDEITTSIRDAASTTDVPEDTGEPTEIQLPPEDPKLEDAQVEPTATETAAPEQTELPLPSVDAPTEEAPKAPKPSEDPKSEKTGDLDSSGDDRAGDDHDKTLDVDAAHAEALIEDAARDAAKASEPSEEAPPEQTAEAAPEAPTEAPKSEAQVPLYDGVHDNATGLTNVLGGDKTDGLKDAAATIYDVRDEMIGLDRSELDAEAQAVLSFFVNQSAAFLAAIESIFKRNR